MTASFCPATAAKDLERRWGLTLVSFASDASRAPLRRVRRLVRRLLDHHLGGRPAEPLVEFYDDAQWHCTHLTLTRSDAWGPVRRSAFVKPGTDPQRLCGILARETAGLGAITVTLDRLELADNGFVLRGSCAGEESAARRAALLERLNERLPGSFHLGRRPWDTDPARHTSVHMRVGFVKRPCDDFPSLVDSVAAAPVEPITISFPAVTVVHHRYRSLRPPHAGAVHFALDGRPAPAPPFAHLNLVP